MEEFWNTELSYPTYAMRHLEVDLPALTKKPTVAMTKVLGYRSRRHELSSVGVED